MSALGVTAGEAGTVMSEAMSGVYRRGDRCDRRRLSAHRVDCRCRLGLGALRFFGVCHWN
jgi:hypothetical protein